MMEPASIQTRVLMLKLEINSRHVFTNQREEYFPLHKIAVVDDGA